VSGDEGKGVAFMGVCVSQTSLLSREILCWDFGKYHINFQKL